MTVGRAALRDPLVWFAALGAAIFALHGACGGALLAGPERIAVDERTRDWLDDSLRRQLGRAPSADELDGATQAHIRTAVLLREARRRGLDRGDPVVERRLVQRIEFVLESEGGAVPPTDAELAQWWSRHPQRYARPASIALSHRFFSLERRGEAARGDSQRALESPADAPGDPFLDGGQRLSGTLDRVAQRVGEPLGHALGELPVGQWSGPIESPFGWHLVRVDARSPASPRPLAEVREAVIRDWLAARRAAALEAGVSALVEQATR